MPRGHRLQEQETLGVAPKHKSGRDLATRDKRDFITKMRTCSHNCQRVGSLQHGQDVFKGWEKVLKRLPVEATRRKTKMSSSTLVQNCTLHWLHAHSRRAAHTLPSLWFLHQSNRSQLVAVSPLPPLLCHQALPHPTIYHPAKKRFFSSVTL